MFNYNAREYDSSTRTFPKTPGQLFDEDLVLYGNPASFDEESVLFPSGGNVYMGKNYFSISENPFNRNLTNSSFTFIYKTSGFTDDSTNIFANRDISNYNYMVRGNMFHTSTSVFLTLTPSASPQIVFIRIYPDGTSERKVVDENGNVLQSVSAQTISWGSQTDGIAFFAGYSNGNEWFIKRFYWMYCSLETLTDEEILKVIKYNEETTTFALDSTGHSFTYEGGTATANLTADLDWSVTSSPSWVTVSPSSGESGTTAITFTIKKNNFSSRTGTVVFTDDEGNEAEYTIEQGGTGGLLPYNKIYRNGRRVN